MQLQGHGQDKVPLAFFSHGVTEGLTQGNVTCSLRDHRGMMWFGTWDGVNLYDGFRNQDFSHPSYNSQRIRGVVINNMLEVDSSQLAISTYIGLSFFLRNKNRFEYCLDEEAYRNCRILKKEGQALLLSSGQEIRKLDLQTRQFTTWNSPLRRAWKQWTSQRKNGVNRSEFLYNRMFQLLEKDPVTFEALSDLSRTLTLNDLVHVPGKNEWFLGCDEGLFTWEPAHKQLKPILPGNAVKSLFPYQEHLYVGTQLAGLFRVAFQNPSQITNFRRTENSKWSLSGNYIRNIYIDPDGQIWLSILGAGINYANLNTRKARTLFSYADLPSGSNQDNYIQALAEDSAGRLWVYSVAGNLKILSPGNQILQSFNASGIDPLRKPSSVQQLFVSSSNTVYLLSNKGLYKWNGKSEFQAIESADSSDGASYMQVVLETEPGSFVVGTRKGLFRFSENEPRLRRLRFPRLDGEVIHFLFQDRKGNLYVNSFFKGIYVLKSKNKIWELAAFRPQVLNLKSGYETPGGILFASTKGLIRLNTDSYETTFLGGPESVIGQTLYSLIPDGHRPDTWWCSGNKGIFAIQLSTGKYLSLGIQDGLSSLEFNTNASVKRKNGELAFGSIDGLTLFRPQEFFASGLSAPWMLDRLEMEGIADSSLHLDFEKAPRQFEVPFEHNGFFCRMVQVRFPHTAGSIRYKLNGHETSWNTGGNPLEIRYSNLPEGTYGFQTEYFDPQKGWIRNHWFQLVIEPPWYRTWWARSGFVLLVVGLISVLVQNYIQLKLQNEREEMVKRNILVQERNRIIADLHDDVGATLSSISIYSEAIKNKLQAHDLDRAMDLILKIGENARDSISNLGDIVWNLNPVNDSTQRLLERMESTASVLCAARNTGLDFYADARLNGEDLSLETKQNLFFIFKEILNNALKYASASRIQVRLEKNKNELRFLVTDNGKGYDASVVAGGHGLANIRRRTTKLGGTCRMESNLAGTRTEIHIPIKTATVQQG